MKFSNYTKLFVITVLTILFIQCTPSTKYRVIDGFTQGTTYHIVYSYNSKDSLNFLVDQVLKQVDTSLSVYNKNSLISRLNRGDSVEMDSLFVNVFNRSREIYDISGGLFDISAAPIFDIYGFGFKNRSVVNQKIIDSILVFVGMEKVCIKDGKLIKSDPRLTLNANAIAQGYTSDLIAHEFDKRGVSDYLIEVGGEIYCKGKNSKGEDWSVAIDKPIDGNMVPGQDMQDIITFTNKGLATSGNYRKFYEENGQKYAHIINPKTGYPTKHNLLSATVIAKDGMTADAYATYFMVVGLEKTKEILANSKDLEAYLVYSEGAQFKVFKTAGIKVRGQ